MADWDPFADPTSDGAEPAAASVSTLPTRPPQPKTSLPLGEFLERLDEICREPEARRGAIDQKLKPLVAQAVGPQTPVFWCVLSRRVVGLLADIREGRVKSMNLLLALQDAFMEVGGSMAGSLEILKPDADFSGSVVLIFGYGGSSLADLADCVPAYRDIDAGCLVVLLVQAFGVQGMYQLADVLESSANAWADARSGCTPRLYVHSFSNMGFSTWLALLKLWEEQVASPDSKRLRGAPPPMDQVLKGVVFDSSPDASNARKAGIQSIIQTWTAGFAMANACDADGQPLDARASQEASMLAKCEFLHDRCPWRLHLESLPEVEVHKMTRANTADMSRLQPSSTPLQFIFSENDVIIRAAGVERYLVDCEGVAASAGAPPPRSLKLRNSGHCLHKQVHREEYWAAVREFWQLTMAAA